jgi:uncharacterized protein (DUF2141 family)
MARFHSVVILLLATFLIAACGQVGTITGGAVDKTAPQPILSEIQPPMASKNTYPEKIVIPFDEFIALNKPGENIRVIPNDVNLEPSIKRKSLVLEKTEGEWQENTTYAVYLSRAVKDITEQNDSLMVYVFSTGQFLDSLQTAVKVVDAFTNQPLKSITVGLYENKLLDDTSKVEPRYISSTDEDGVALFQYLKKGPFYAYAFEDENRNNRMDENEKRAGLESLVYGDTGIVTGPIMRLMPPKKTGEWEVKSNEVILPGNWCMSFSKPLDTSVSFNFQDLEPISSEWNEYRDSVTHYFLNKNNSGSYKVIIEEENRRDTVSKKFFFKTPYEYKVETNIINYMLLAGDTLKISLEEPILNYDKSLMKAQYKKIGDSVFTPLDFTVDRTDLKSALVIHDLSVNEVEFTIYPKGLNGYNKAQKDSVFINYTVQPEEKAGNLEVEFDTIAPYGILHLLDSKKNVVDEVAFNGNQNESVIFKNLQPGKYSFYFVVDEDRNGKWSTGSLFNSKEPEKVIWFLNPSTVRANWEVKTTLSITKKKEIDTD